MAEEIAQRESGLVRALVDSFPILEGICAGYAVRLTGYPIIAFVPPVAESILHLSGGVNNFESPSILNPLQDKEKQAGSFLKYSFGVALSYMDNIAICLMGDHTVALQYIADIVDKF